uniref:Uncharacterized protein n=1 Tax=Arundo donax TaxID=35708 RepID=A0A0A8XY38_ARUDO
MQALEYNRRGNESHSSNSSHPQNLSIEVNDRSSSATLTNPTINEHIMIAFKYAWALVLNAPMIYIQI